MSIYNVFNTHYIEYMYVYGVSICIINLLGLKRIPLIFEYSFVLKAFKCNIMPFDYSFCNHVGLRMRISLVEPRGFAQMHFTRRICGSYL